MLRIYLMRHGQDQDNAKNILNGHRNKPLTDKGIAQAQKIAKQIEATGLNFRVILTSPLKRTIQTAQIIAKVLQTEQPLIRPELIERNFGLMTGQAKTAITKKIAGKLLKTDKIIYFLNPQGAETFPQLISRAEEILKKIKKDYKTGNILVVTHGDIGKMIYAAYYKLDWRKILTQFHFGNSDLLLLAPNSPAKQSHVFHIKQFNT